MLSLNGSAEVEITWMEWLLTQAKNIADGYGITYDLSEKQQNASRSGRAIMIPTTVEGIFPYQIPQQLLPRGSSENFIEEIAKDNQLIGRLKAMAIRNINIEISRLRK